MSNVTATADQDIERIMQSATRHGRESERDGLRASESERERANVQLHHVDKQPVEFNMCAHTDMNATKPGYIHLRIEACACIVLSWSIMIRFV